jgi:glycosyltransferase involved in cell wall biosynthesis
MASGLRRARRVLAVSRATEQDVARLFPDLAGKVILARPGATEIFRPADPIRVAEVRRRFGLPATYVVSVGNRKPLKNLGVAAAAVRTVRASHPALGWVVVGQRFVSPDEVDRVRPHMGRALIELSEVTDRDLCPIYTGAIALLMPSRWEGFGSPAVEAMACGTPVVGADIPALREVLGDAGLLCGVDDVRGFGAMLCQLLDDHELRSALSQRGQDRAREFTWERAAAEAWRSFEESLD